MQRFSVPIFALLVAAVAVLVYAARPTESAFEFAKRKCTESREPGITFEKCVEGRTLQYYAGRPDHER